MIPATPTPAENLQQALEDARVHIQPGYFDDLTDEDALRYLMAAVAEYLATEERP